MRPHKIFIRIGTGLVVLFFALSVISFWAAHDICIRSWNRKAFVARRAAIQIVINRDVGHVFTAMGLPACSYHPLDRLTIFTTSSMTGTSMRTPTTVANAAPE